MARSDHPRTTRDGTLPGRSRDAPFVPSSPVLSFVLRLVPDALAAGIVAGQVIEIGTETTLTFRSIDELLSILRSHGGPLTPPESA